MSKNKEEDFGRFKFDEFKVCKNPDTDFEFVGELVDYKVLHARHSVGHDAGYSYALKSDLFLQAVISVTKMPSRGTAFSEKTDAIAEAALELYSRLESVLSSNKLNLDDLPPLHEYLKSQGINYLKKLNQHSMNKKNNSVGKGISALLDKQATVPEAGVMQKRNLKTFRSTGSFLIQTSHGLSLISMPLMSSSIPSGRRVFSNPSWYGQMASTL